MLCCFFPKFEPADSVLNFMYVCQSPTY